MLAVCWRTCRLNINFESALNAAEEYQRVSEMCAMSTLYSLWKRTPRRWREHWRQYSLGSIFCSSGSWVCAQWHRLTGSPPAPTAAAQTVLHWAGNNRATIQIAIARLALDLDRRRRVEGATFQDQIAEKCTHTLHWILALNAILNCYHFQHIVTTITHSSSSTAACSAVTCHLPVTMLVFLKNGHTATALLLATLFALSPFLAWPAQSWSWNGNTFDENSMFNSVGAAIDFFLSFLCS